MVRICRRLMAGHASGFPEEQILALHLLRRCLFAVEPPRHRIQLRGRREIDHVLHLRHMRHQQTVDHIHAFFDRPDLIAVEIGGALLELGEILHGPQAALRPMNLLVEHPAKADRIEAHAITLRARVRIQVELAGGVEINVAIETRHPQARLQ